MAMREITFNGKTQSMAAWAREINVNPITLSGRLHSGWTVEEALTTPTNTKMANRRPKDQIPTQRKVYGPRKPMKTVWRHLFEALEPNKIYPPSHAATLTSGGRAQKAMKNSEFPIHTYEGGFRGVKGEDIRQWVLRNFDIVDMEKFEPKTPKAKRKYTHKVQPTDPSTTPLVKTTYCVKWYALVVAAIIGIAVGLLSKLLHI